MYAYAASKRALCTLVESLSAEQREIDIRVNAVLLSIIDTPANRNSMPAADATRWVDPRDLTNVIVLLAVRMHAPFTACRYLFRGCPEGTGWASVGTNDTSFRGKTTAVAPPTLVVLAR